MGGNFFKNLSLSSSKMIINELDFLILKLTLKIVLKGSKNYAFVKSKSDELLTNKIELNKI